MLIRKTNKILNLLHHKDLLLRNELDGRFENVHYILQKEHEGLALLQERICRSKEQAMVQNLKVWGHAENVHFMQTITGLRRDCTYDNPMTIMTDEELQLLCRAHLGPPLRHQFCDTMKIREVF